MKKRVFFHVGSVKTGSTFIQKFIFDNKDLFHEIGVDYLTLAPLRLDLPRYANADFILDKNFAKDAVVKAIDQSPCNNILFSDEGLVARPDIPTHGAFEGYDKTVILYVRPPVDLIASWAAESSLPYNYWTGSHAACNGIIPVEKGIPRLLWEYHVTMKNFLNALDKRPDIRLLIRPYARDKFVNGHIMDDFISSFDIEIPGSMRKAIDEAQAVVNEGKTRKYCDIAVVCADEVQRYGALAQFSNNLVNYAYAACKSGDDRKVVDTLSDDQMRAIQKALKPTYDRLQSRGSVFEGFDKAMLPPIFGDNRPAYQPVNESELKSIVADFLFKA